MLERLGSRAAASLGTRLGPGVPTMFLATNNNSTTQNYLSWESPTSGPIATSYKLERAPYSSNTWSTIYTGSNKNYTDTGLTGNTIYQYRVSGIAASGAVGMPTDVIERQTLCIFTSSGTWTRPAGCTAVEMLLVGGGGYGGYAAYEVSDIGTWGYEEAAAAAFGGGGGGAVRYFSSRNLAQVTSSYLVTVGAGGSGGGATAAGSSVFDGITSPGGFNAYWAPPTPGNSGASGSGASGYYEFAGAGVDRGKLARSSYNATYGYIGGDTSGSYYDASFNQIAQGGGGGGAGGAASGINSGIGIVSSITGTSVEYGIGGNGCAVYNNLLLGGSGAPPANSGRGGSTNSSWTYYSSTFSYADGNNGAAGIVVIKAL